MGDYLGPVIYQCPSSGHCPRSAIHLKESLKQGSRFLGYGKGTLVIES